VREPNLEALMRGRTKYDPPRFMTVNTAVAQLLEIEAKRGEGGALRRVRRRCRRCRRRCRRCRPASYSHASPLRRLPCVLLHRRCAVCRPTDLGIGLARVGQDSQTIVAGTLAELLDVDFGPPLHSLVICSGARARRAKVKFAAL